MKRKNYALLVEIMLIIVLSAAFIQCDLHDWGKYPAFGNANDDDATGDDDASGDDDDTSGDDDTGGDDDLTSQDWTNKETAVSVGNAQYLSAAFSADGQKIMVAFYDDGPKTLRYTVKSGSSWESPSDVDTGVQTGKFPSIAVDSGGHPGIAYQGDGSGEVRYAYNDGAGWTTAVVDTSSITGWYNSLAFLNDEPCIAWQDMDNGLNYSCHSSTKGDAGWGTPEHVDGDPGDDVGSYASLVFDHDDVPHIAYRSSEDKVQKHAYKDAVWMPEVVDSDSSTDVGGYCSLGVDSSNALHLAYYDQDNGVLMYAKKESGKAVWNKEVVDDSGDVGWDASLKLRQDQHPCISYKDVQNNYLRFACKEGDDNWVIEAPDTTSGVGRYSNLLIDPNSGAYHILYNDGGASGKILHVWRNP